jgi:2,4-dienoyl-CoA reductase-like NADH-dependent reductase (Old Yellow Enzyme family)
MPEDDQYQNLTLLEHFTSIDFKKVALTVAGKISSGEDVSKILNSGVDFVTVGKSGILHHDFPVKVIENPNFESIKTPVSEQYLLNEGLSKKFIKYMSRWPNFVEQES